MRRKLRVFTWRYRYVLAAALFGTAALLVLHQMRPPPPGIEVVVALNDLPAGQEIRPEHVTRTALAVPPENILTNPIGEIPIVSIPAGLPIAESMVLGPGLADHAPPGTVVAPVHVADPAILQFLRVGDTVDLYGAGVDVGAPGLGTQLVAAGTLVLALPGEQSGGLGFLSTSPREHAMFIAAIRHESASLFTGASGLAPFRVVISSTHN